MSHFVDSEPCGAPVVESSTPERWWEVPGDRVLMAEFTGWVEAAELVDYVSLVPGQKNLPRNIGEFELVPLVGDSPEGGSDFVALYTNTYPADIVCDLEDGPFLDTNIAIGLAYRKTLIGLAAGALVRPDVLQIAQIQATVPGNLSRDELRRSGLFSGSYWRDTLVRAWIGLADELGIGVVEVQSGVNNMWANNSKPEDLEGRLVQFAANHDVVAERMGFLQASDGNWVLRLAGSQSVA